MTEKNTQFSPKNIAQIGEMSDYYKVYMEDYVFTFLRQLVRREEPFSQAVLLVGERHWYEDKCVNTIYGAVEGKKLRLEENEMLFGEEDQRYLEGMHHKYFGQYEILGWAVIESPFNVISSGTMWKDMGGSFQKENKILLHFSKEEKYPTLYCNYHNQIRQLDGYSIFYDDNKTMQQYLILWNRWNRELLQEKEEVAIQKFRQCMNEKQVRVKEAKNRNYMMAASLCMLMFVMVTGIFMINSYKHLKNVENTMHQLTNSMEAEIQEMILVNTNQKENDYLIIEKKEELSLEETYATTELEVLEKEVFIYVVQAGDTLREICQSYYGDEENIQDVCMMNYIENPNYIQIGQKILLP